MNRTVADSDNGNNIRMDGERVWSFGYPEGWRAVDDYGIRWQIQGGWWMDMDS